MILIKRMQWKNNFKSNVCVVFWEKLSGLISVIYIIFHMKRYQNFCQVVLTMLWQGIILSHACDTSRAY